MRAWWATSFEENTPRRSYTAERFCHSSFDFVAAHIAGNANWNISQAMQATKLHKMLYNIRRQHEFAWWYTADSAEHMRHVMFTYLKRQLSRIVYRFQCYGNVLGYATCRMQRVVWLKECFIYCREKSLNEFVCLFIHCECQCNFWAAKKYFSNLNSIMGCRMSSSIPTWQTINDKRAFAVFVLSKSHLKYSLLMEIDCLARSFGVRFVCNSSAHNR